MNNDQNSSEYSGFLVVAERAARAAGGFLLTKMGQVAVREKNPGDFVTQADIESQRLIQDLINTEFPHHDFLGEEEQSEMSNIDGQSEYCWIVDPIDGTTNFIHQLPSFSVSIALRKSNQMILGCIYDPILDEMYCAVTGQGATLNGTPIKTSGRTASRRSIVVCSLPRQLNRQSVELKQLVNVLCDCDATVRRLGSAALNLCYIASGRVDAYWTTLAEIWDVAAGIVILQEAGGQLNHISGKDLDLNDLQLIAGATPELNQELIHHLSKP